MDFCIGCLATNRQGATQVPIYQKGQKELVFDRSDRSVQEMEVAKRRGIGDGVRELRFVRNSLVLGNAFLLIFIMFKTVRTRNRKATRTIG